MHVWPGASSLPSNPVLDGPLAGMPDYTSCLVISHPRGEKNVPGMPALPGLFPACLSCSNMIYWPYSARQAWACLFRASPDPALRFHQPVPITVPGPSGMQNDADEQINGTRSKTSAAGSWHRPSLFLLYLYSRLYSSMSCDSTFVNLPSC